MIFNNKIYDRDLLINLSNSFCYILLNSDSNMIIDYWSRKFYIYGYELVDINLIKFNGSYKIMNIPDTHKFTLNKILMCMDIDLIKLIYIIGKNINFVNCSNYLIDFNDLNKKYSFGVINSISSEPSFSPYWCTFIILFECVKGIYVELNSINIDNININTNGQGYEQYYNQINYLDISNPFVNQIEHFTHQIYSF